MGIRCIAVDDEPLALAKIREHIRRIGYLDLLRCFDNAMDAIEFLNETSVDVLFLDIQMDDLTGIQMLESLNARPLVVLTTAYDEYAIKGFDLDVCDYLLKPVSFQRFLQACDKVYHQVGSSGKPYADASEDDTPGSEGYFFVKSGSVMQKINFEDILFVEGMKDYLRIWTLKEKVMTLLSFRKIQSAMPASGFIRIHKSYLISVSKIETIERNHVSVAGQLLPIGESYRRHFLREIEKKRIN